MWNRIIGEIMSIIASGLIAGGGGCCISNKNLYQGLTLGIKYIVYAHRHIKVYSKCT